MVAGECDAGVVNRFGLTAAAVVDGHSARAANRHLIANLSRKI